MTVPQHVPCRAHHDPATTHMVRVLGEITENNRKFWRVALVEENGKRLVETRLFRKFPDGSTAATHHRSTIRIEAAGALGEAIRSADALNLAGSS